MGNREQPQNANLLTPKERRSSTGLEVDVVDYEQSVFALRVSAAAKMSSRTRPITVAWRSSSSRTRARSKDQVNKLRHPLDTACASVTHSFGCEQTAPC